MLLLQKDARRSNKTRSDIFVRFAELTELVDGETVVDREIETSQLPNRIATVSKQKVTHRENRKSYIFN